MKRRKAHAILLCLVACAAALVVALALYDSAGQGIPQELERDDLVAKAVAEALSDLRKSPPGYEVRSGKPRVVRSPALQAFPECVFLVVAVHIAGTGASETVLEPILDPTAHDSPTRQHQFIVVHRPTSKVWKFSHQDSSNLGQFLSAQGYRLKPSEDEKSFWKVLEALRFCSRQHGVHRWIEKDVCEFPLSQASSQNRILQVQVDAENVVISMRNR